MRTHRLPIAAALLVVGAMTFAGFHLPLAPTVALAAQSASMRAGRLPAAPRAAAKATKLARQSVTQIARSYAKGYANIVCADLTARTRQLLGGKSSCAAKVRLARESEPISKISIKKIAFRSKRAWASVSGYLNGNRKRRLVVALRWEAGRYRLDHAVSGLESLFR